MDLIYDLSIRYLVKLSVISRKAAQKHLMLSSRKHIRTKVTPDLHLTYSKNGGNLGLVLKRYKVVISL